MLARSRIAALMTLLVATSFAHAQQPATSALTYQGRLSNAGSPANGSYDFQFSLWNAASGGAQLGPTLSPSAIAVSAGLFTVPLDFGRVYESKRLWLEIAARPTGAPSFTTLTPRQELTATPYANGLSVPVAINADAGIAFPFYVVTNGGGGSGAGVIGLSSSLNGNGVAGEADSGVDARGVWGYSQFGRGVVGQGGAAGVRGESLGSGVNALGVLGLGGTSGFIGVRGESTVGGAAGYGVYGLSTSPLSTGVVGIANTGNSYGVWGQASQGSAVVGNGATGGLFSGTGGSGISASTIANSTTIAGVNGLGQTGVRGDSSAGGSASYGVYGSSTAAGGNGVRGDCNGSSSSFAVWGVNAAPGFAGYFSGNVNVTGSLAKSGGSFKIDHPLDPANMYLYHSFVESPDMMNVYNGNAQLDASGSAVIAMPEWFTALNRDFRYQLTAVGAPGPNLYIARKMDASGTFAISGGTPGGEVSWQITGIRQDAWANAHRIPTEEIKTGPERGQFLHPELYGFDRSRSVTAWKEQATSGTAPMKAPAIKTMDPALLRPTPPSDKTPPAPANDTAHGASASK